jgi:hypothetical protein
MKKERAQTVADKKRARSVKPAAAGGKASGKSGRRPMKAHRKYKWTPTETMDLVKAVKEYHEGKTFLPFAQILSDMNYTFHEGRTALHLGDKWKRLKSEYPPGEDYDQLCDHIIAQEKERMKLGPNANLHRRLTKGPRKRWAEGEVQALTRGHNKHGNKWATILRESRDEFDHKRTTMDLKDKWRNIQQGPSSSGAKKRPKKVEKKTTMTL